MLTNFTSRVTIVTSILAIALIFNASAQTSVRPYSLVYSANIKGGVTMIGNTSMAIKKTNGTVNTDKMNDIAVSTHIGSTTYGNDSENMQFVDVDSNSETSNSSSAVLTLPSGNNTIKFARLYWGGRITNSAVNADPTILRKIKIRKGSVGTYSTATAPASNVDQFTLAGTTDRVYQCYVDITDYMQQSGPGNFFVADIAASPGSRTNGGSYAGWGIVVAYENPNSNYYSVRVYDGYSQVYSTSSGPVVADVTLTGLNVPNNPLTASDAVMSVMAWEGDGNLGATTNNPAGDYIKVNNVSVFNETNPVTNFWNGSITKNGAYVTTKNPDYRNQMGIDIDEVNVGVGYGIQPNAISVNIKFGTEADQYFPSAFTFAIRMKDPILSVKKTAADASGNGTLESQEEITYTFAGSNSGAAPSYGTYLVDTLPSNVTYVPNSLEVVSAPGLTPGIKTDAQDGDIAFVKTQNGKTYVKFFIGEGATSTEGGVMPIGSSYVLRIKVKAAVIPGSVTNTVRLFTSSQAGDNFTDESTAVISPSGGPLDVKLVSFSATLVNHNTLVKWETESEINNAYFDVERSENGVNFKPVGRVQGNGTTSIRSYYNFTDVLNTNANILYYRLKSVDNNGKFTYSNIVAIRLDGKLNITKFSVYPNPTVNNVKISLNSSSASETVVRVMSLEGKEVMVRKVKVQKGDNIIVVPEFEKLQTGTYICEISNGTDRFVQKVVKN